MGLQPATPSIPVTQKGSANGVATLDATTELPESQNTRSKGGTFYAKLYPGASDDIKAQAALNACVAAGGGTVVIPAGGILDWTTTPLNFPQYDANIHVTVRGAGLGATVRLSATCPRFADFNRTADDQTFGNVTIENLTIDANMINGAHHIVLGTYINGFGTAAKRVNLTDIKIRNVKVINAPTNADSSTAFRIGIALTSYHTGSAEAQTSIQNVLIEDFDMVANGNSAVVITGESAASTVNVLLDNIKLNRVKCSTFLTTTTGSHSLPVATLNVSDTSGLSSSGQVRIGTSGASQVVAYTGKTGSTLTGCSGGTGTIAAGSPVGFPFTSNIIIGNKGIGGKYVLRDCYAANSGDNNIECDSAADLLLDNCVCENGHNYGFYFQNYNVSLNPNGQRVTYRSCTYKHTQPYHSAQGFGTGTMSGQTLPSYVLDKCKAFVSADPDANVTGMGISIAGSVISEIIITDFKIDANFAASLSATSAFSLVRIFPSSVRQRISIRGMELTTRGVITANANTIIGSLITLNGSDAQFNVNDIRFDWNLTYGAASAQPFMRIGQFGASTMAGNIRRAVVKSTSGQPTSAVAIQISDTNLTLNASHRVSVQDSDFSIMSSAMTAVQVVGSTKQPFVRVKDCVWPAGIAPAATAISPGASPFAYQNLDLYDERIVVQGGTVSKIELSVDGTNYTDVGVIAGSFILRSGEYLRVTYTVVPTMTKVPLP